MVIKREIVSTLKQALSLEKILLVNGSRQSGKTTALKQLQAELTQEGKKSFYITLEDRGYLDLLNLSPKNIFRIIPQSTEKTYLFIDEIQYLSDPSSFLKYLYDEHKNSVQLIVTGSSSFYIDKKFKDSLAGRKKLYALYTLSFREFLVFKKEQSLAKLLGKNIPLIYQEKLLSYLMEFFLYGGYPEVVLAPLSEKKEILRELAYSYIKKDISEAGIMNIANYYRVFKTLASQSGALLNLSELSRSLSVPRSQLDSIIETMRKSFHVTLLTPFHNNIKKELTKMPKIYINDTGLMNFFSGSFDPVDVREDKGKIFETAVHRALLEGRYSDQLHFWRRQDGKEIDFVLPEEKLAYEVKYSDSGFKQKMIKTFTDQHPNFTLKCVTINRKIDNESELFISFWELI